ESDALLELAVGPRCQVDGTHAAAADLPLDRVGADAGARGQGAARLDLVGELLPQLAAQRASRGQERVVSLAQRPISLFSQERASPHARCTVRGDTPSASPV